MQRGKGSVVPSSPYDRNSPSLPLPHSLCPSPNPPQSILDTWCQLWATVKLYPSPSVAFRPPLPYSHLAAIHSSDIWCWLTDLSSIKDNKKLLYVGLCMVFAKTYWWSHCSSLMLGSEFPHNAIHKNVKAEYRQEITRLQEILGVSWTHIKSCTVAGLQAHMRLSRNLWVTLLKWFSTVCPQVYVCVCVSTWVSVWHHRESQVSKSVSVSI